MLIIMNQNTILIIGTFSISITSAILLLYVGARVRERSEIVKANHPVNIEVKDQNLIQISDLHLLKKVSDEHIELLYEEQIYSIEGLREKLISKQDTDSFSKKLGLYQSLVYDWVRLGEFSILDGITQEYIDLLEIIGIETIMDLVDQDPEIVYYQLRQVTDSITLPTLGMIIRWVRVSNGTRERENQRLLIIE